MRIFMSYRRADTEGYAGRLYDRLSQHFGPESLFMDIDTLKPGQDFVEAIEEAVGSCDVLIALIGERWLGITDAEGRRRLDDPHDFVRLEIATALKRDVWVVPMLVQDATMPRPDDLPDDLVKLRRRHALEITATHFHDDVDRLVQTIGEVLGTREAASTPTPEPGFSLPMLEWVDIPAGSVTLETGQTFPVKPFKMSKFPVTYAQFQTFIDAPDGFYSDVGWNRLAERPDEPGEQKWPIDNRPRENVNWYDAVAFCRWVAGRMEGEVRLPTEWEWQWAAQGDDKHKYPWGNIFDPDQCNTKESGMRRTTPVDAYPSGASPFGVIDMSGNVWEWCLNEYDVPENVGLAGNAARVVRGGSCYYAQDLAHTTTRRILVPYYRSSGIGFRVVMAIAD